LAGRAAASSSAASEALGASSGVAPGASSGAASGVAPVVDAAGALLVVAGIVWKDGLFLGVERPKGKAHAGWWEFPGGKVEQGESLKAALIRELEEELAFTSTRLAFWREKRFVYPQGAVHLNFFHVTAFEGEVVPQEGQRFAWFKPGEADVSIFLPANADIVPALSWPLGE